MNYAFNNSWISIPLCDVTLQCQNVGRKSLKSTIKFNGLYVYNEIECDQKIAMVPFLLTFYAPNLGSRTQNMTSLAF